jgi:uncharacterized protein (TIGR02231 family)
MTKDLKLEAPIMDVTVFQGRALVVREGKVDVEPGEHTIVLEDLPLSISADSLRVSGEGVPGTMITGAEIKRTFMAETQDQERKELEEKYKAALERQAEIQEEHDELSRQMNQLELAAQNFLEAFPKALAYHKSNIDDHKRFMEYIIEQRKELGKAIRAKKRELEKAAREVDKVQGYLDLTASKAGREMNNVEIGVMAKKPGPLKLTVNYVISGASWEPVYDARVMTDEGVVNFSYYGIVRQSTGEDWENVSLTLSTAPHTESRELPELQPWYLNTYRPEPRRSMLKRKVAKEQMAFSRGVGGAPASAPMEDARYDAEMAEEEPLLEGLDMAQAEVQESGEAIVFKVQRRDSIPSDNQPKKLAVTIMDLKCRTEYLAVPKLTPEAYVKAKIKNSSEFVFLSGKVNLFQEDDFIGSTYMSTIAPNEKFDLALGVARRIKIERELVKKDTEGAGLLRGARKLTYGYKIKVENHKKAKARFVIMDQLPVPNHEDIKVEPLKLDPEPKKIDDLKIITWKFSLEPEHKKTLKLYFSVEHPTKNFTVYGLPE